MSWIRGCLLKIDKIQIIILIVMQKYRLFDKITKTNTYAFYRAEHIESRENHIVKKLVKESSWEEILKNKNISLMNHSKIKYIASIKEIVRDQNNFYCVFDNMDKNLEHIIRGEIEKEDIYKIGRALIQLIVEFYEHRIIPRQLRPSAIFVSNSYLNLKLAHLEAFSSKDLTKLDLVELQDLQYSSPETVLTSRDIDQRSLIFTVALIICQLIMGKPLLTANTKKHYMYELCKLFPQEPIEEEQNQSKSKLKQNQQQTFERILGEYDISNQFIALLREMLKIDKNQRIAISELLEAFDLIVNNEENFKKQQKLKDEEAEINIKPNVNQAPINKEILSVQIDFDFDKKPTLSSQPALKVHNSILPCERNVDDDTVQPIIIKKSSKPFEPDQTGMPKMLNKEAMKVSRSTKQQTLSTVKRPQLTNYALNQNSNLGVKLGFHPTIFSENQNDF